MIYSFVEGNDDELFMKHILKDHFHYTDFKIIKYAQINASKVSYYINKCTQAGHNFIFLHDMDDAKDNDDKKKEVQTKYSIEQLESIIIVITEIESWYLAGVDFKRFKIKKNKIINTESVTKEDFYNIIDKTILKKKYPNVTKLTEILAYFNVEQGKQKNSSFNDFMTKLQSIL